LEVFIAEWVNVQVGIDAKSIGSSNVSEELAAAIFRP